jgi:hypothetical protein
MFRKSALAAVTLGLLAVPAWAHSYRVVLSAPGAGQKMLVGHAGVQAIDERTATALVRLISPGAEVRQRGTIRVLVMNLGNTPFDFGPDQVALRLGDGTVLKPSPLDQFLKGKELVEQESHRASVIDRQNQNDIEALASQTSGGSGAAPSAPVPGGSTMASTPSGSIAGEDRRTDDELLMGSTELDAINQILDAPYPVAPRKAWGGYYVFDVPRSVLERGADQPMTILVTTGRQQHRFAATLKWK